MSEPVPLQIAPGVFRSGTEYQAKGRWYDTNLVRWYDNVGLGPVLGWVTKSTTAVAGTPRAIITWRANDGVRRAAIGTHSKLYAMSDTGVLTDITPVGFTSGRVDATVLLGYGQGIYGSWAYGTPRPDVGNILDATVWDLDIWGQYLVGCSPDDGKLYEYQNTGAATVITNAPTGCGGLVVHPKRFVIALGAGSNPRKWQWCDLGVNTTWTPSATNQAGSNEVQKGKLLCARAVGDQVLMLTNIDAHIVDYQGLPYVLVARQVGDSCGGVSKKCIASSGQMAVWWSRSGFWIWDGAARPLPCEVWDDLLRNLTASQQSKVTAFHNAKYSEFQWHAPMYGAAENSHYVFWNYKHDHWGFGRIVRLCGSDPGIFTTPFLCGVDGYVYDHENGYSYGGDAPYARGGPVEIGNGDRIQHVLGLIPDEKTVGDVTVSFNTRNYPNGAETILGSTTLGSTGKADIRFSARQVELVVTSARATDWRWGGARLVVAQGGKRGA